MDPGEDCDDGNTAAGDGCAADCTLEGLCGNGVKDPGELCDQGNTGGTGCTAQCGFAAGGVCALAVDVETAANVSVEGNTWTLDVLGPQALQEDLVNPCGDGRTFPFVYRHTVRIGPRPSALAVRAVDPLQRGAAFTLWVDGDCANAPATRTCSADDGPARDAVLDTNVFAAGSLVTVVVASPAPAAPAGYTLQFTQLPLTHVDNAATCTAAAVVEPGVLRATLRAPATGPALTCGGATSAAAYVRVSGPLGPAAANVSVMGALATAQWSTLDCDAVLGCGTDALVYGDDAFAVLGLHGADAATVDARVETIGVGSLGESCGTTPAAGCAANLWCVGIPWGRSCEAAVGDIWAQNFSAPPTGVTVGDGGLDGVGFEHCAQPGCTQPNTTGGAGGFLLARASGGATLETWTLPDVDLTAYAGVSLLLRQQLLLGTAGVDVAVDGGPYVTVARFYASPAAGQQVLDLTPWAVGYAAVSLRLWFQGDATAGAAWLLDDVSLFPF